jgi:hypothetical protein
MSKEAKDLLGTLSPIYGMATGRGMFGKDVGILPALAGKLREDRAEEERQKAIAASAQGQPMKKGGKVSSASSRADGCAQRGKTKGKMV